MPQPTLAYAPEAVEAFYRTTLLFRGLDPQLVAWAAAQTEASQYREGKVLVQAGTPAAALGIVSNGRATAHLVSATTGATTPVESTIAGDHFGEVGLLLGTVHPFTVIADEPTVVLWLRAEAVESLSAQVPLFSQALARRLATRIVQLGVTALRATQASSVRPPKQASDPPTFPGTMPTATLLSLSTAPASASTVAFVETGDFPDLTRLAPLLPAKLMTQRRLLPLRQEGNTLLVGMVHPKDPLARAELARYLPNVEFELAALGADDFAAASARLRLDASRDPAAKVDGGSVPPEALAFDASDAERELDKAVRVIGDEVVRTANRIVAAALTREASDIHIEPEAGGVKVRFRVNGMLQDWNEMVPPAFSRGLVARFKVLAGLDITERRLPQDGRIGLTAGKREIDMRLSSLPSGRGEKIVLRIFEAAGATRPIEQIFVDPTLLGMMRSAVQRPFGAILVGGPTGSGKSSTLYSLLHERKRSRPDSNVTTVEDPIEYRLAGITQVQVNHAVGLGFAEVLRSMLRQDPDVISVGEMRDSETARMAIESAMTGHLLLTSIHASNALSVVQRLETLGCSRTMIAQAVATVLVQRLVRKLCQSCARVEPVAPLLLRGLVARKLVEPNTQPSLPRPVGCDQCQGTGFSGRVVVFESLGVDDEIRTSLMGGESLADIERSAIASGKLRPFSTYASALMARRLLAPSEAILGVTD